MTIIITFTIRNRSTKQHIVRTIVVVFRYDINITGVATTASPISQVYLMYSTCETRLWTRLGRVPVETFLLAAAWRLCRPNHQ